MSHEVRTHVRTVNGKKVTVRQHSRQDDGGDSWEHDSSDEDGAAQRKRHQFEGRVLRERQAAEARYGQGARRPAGERRRRKKRGPKPARAKRHAKKAMRLWRRHKVKAVFYGGLALSEIGAWAAWRGTSRAWKASGTARKAVRRRLHRRRP